MGLDIFITFDNDEQIRNANYYANHEMYSNRHNVSRTFCNFICRQHVVNGVPELDQIGEITGIDISPIYDLEKYWDDESAEHQLSFAENEEERKQTLKRIEADRDSLKGNIDVIQMTVSSLIEKLSGINNLDKRLNDYGYDTLDYEQYFTDFNIDKSISYTRNNFGQDLRNFKNYLEFAKSKGSTTVWFNYG
jgi:hypothetical protein